MKEFENEIWKDIKDYEGLYQISNLGRVKSIGRFITARGGSKRRSFDRILKPATEKIGYKSVVLQNGKKGSTFKIHRLLAEAFIPNPENKRTVNHIDGNKRNNDLANLEWATYGENEKHAYRTGLKIGAFLGKSGINHHISKPVVQFSLEMEFISNFESAYEVERKLGFGDTPIANCCKNRTKTSFGYIWKYGWYDKQSGVILKENPNKELLTKTENETTKS